MLLLKGFFINLDKEYFIPIFRPLENNNFLLCKSVVLTGVVKEIYSLSAFDIDVV